jgi:transcriptional regulator with XRE-family HTH domain
MTAESRRAIGAALRTARVNRGQTQQQIGENVGLSRQMINRYENGRDAPKAENLGKLLKYLGIRIPLPDHDYVLAAEAFEKPVLELETPAEQLNLELDKPSEFTDAYVRIFPKKTSIEIVISRVAAGGRVR